MTVYIFEGDTYKDEEENTYEVVSINSLEDLIEVKVSFLENRTHLYPLLMFANWAERGTLVPLKTRPMYEGEDWV